MLIAMAGLPSTGKSTLASCVESEIGAVVLDKDRVRAALFPPRVLDYSAVQNDIAMAAIYEAVRAIHKANPKQAVILDGRTFLRPGQVQSLLDLASSLDEKPWIIECVCETLGRSSIDLANTKSWTPQTRAREARGKGLSRGLGLVVLVAKDVRARSNPSRP